MNRLEYSVMSPSGDKQRPNDPSTERILCQALNVVSSQASSYGLTSEVNLKKIAKKRRGADGTVDVEYTKSSKEYLQKAQQSLRQDVSCSNNSSTEHSSSSSISNPYGYEDADAATTTTQSSASNPYGYDDHNSGPTNRLGPAHRSFSQPTLQSSSNLYGYGDPDASSSPNEYGYEDPDAAPTIRRRGPARRRGSVTKFSIQAAAAATAATDRILQKTNLLHQKEVFSGAEPAVAAEGEGEWRPRRSSMPDKKEPRLRRSVGLLSNSRGRFGRISMEDQRKQDVPVVSNGDKPCGSDMKPITPKRQRSLRESRRAVHDAGLTSPQSLKKSIVAASPKAEDYGYGDHDAKSSSDSSTGAPERMELPQNASSASSNAYGYGESAAPVRPRSRPRARRRGSVTKFSLEAQAKVITSQPMKTEPSHTTLETEIISLNDEPIIASTLGPETETTLNDVAGGESRWSLIVPDQAFGHRAPQRTASNQSFKRNFLVPNRSNSIRSIARAAARLRKDNDNSMNDSLGSNCSLEDDTNFQPQRAAQPPTRSASWRRAFSRSNSAGSMGSDCDSLASDLISLCSISVRTDDKPGAPSPAASFKKSIVNRTPSKLGKQNSNGSLLGGRSTGKQAEDEDGGSVTALKALNLDNSIQAYVAPTATNSKQPVYRSYSGERIRTMRD